MKCPHKLDLKSSLWGHFLFGRIFLAMCIDFFNDNFADCNTGNCQKHAGHPKKLPAKDYAQDNCHRVKIHGPANQGRVDYVMVDLRQDQIEA